MTCDDCGTEISCSTGTIISMALTDYTGQRIVCGPCLIKRVDERQKPWQTT